MRTFLIIISMFFTFAASSTTIDAVVYYSSEYAYFFKGNTVAEFNLVKDKAENSMSIREAFPGVTFKKVDAAVNYGNGKIYFFSDGKYCRFDIAADRADEGYPKYVNASSWPGLGSDIHAAINWPQKTYFFYTGEYIRYDRENDAADAGYPSALSSNSWPGMRFSDIDASFALPSGKCYLFSGNQYYRYDIANDAADADYPRVINSKSWPGLTEALNGNFDDNNYVNNDYNDNDYVDNNVNRFDYETYSVLKSQVSLAPYYVSSDETRTICEHYAYQNPQGGVYLVVKQDFNTVIYNFDTNLKPQAKPILIRNVEFSDMHISNNGTIAMLGGKDVNNYYIEGYSNTIAFIKIDKNGNILRNINIYGGEGHEFGDSWFDGRSRARITCNGSEYGMYFEVQKNFEDDNTVHNGDAFYVSDLNGNVKEDRTHFWTASHSQTVRTTCEPNGDFFTLTSGDAYPFGIQFYNRNTSENDVVWPPVADRITYAEVKSASAAGVMSFMDYNDGNIIAFLLTTNKPNYGDGRPLDPMFIKIDKHGNLIKKKWLDVSSNFNDDNMTAQRLGDDYLVTWTELDSDGFKIAKVNSSGEIIGFPQNVNHPLGYNGFIVPLSENEAVWFEGDRNGSTELNAYKIKFRD